MGTDFYLACQNCKEFLSLHKWPPVKSAGSTLVKTEPLGDSQNYGPSPDGIYRIVQISAGQIFAGLATCTPSQEYIQALIPLTETFATQHEKHALFLTCDIGNLPWEPGEPDFAAWKEHPGPCYETPYLPRNLIEIHGIQTWEQALALIEEQHAWLLHPQLKDDLAAIRMAFEKRSGGK